MKIIDRPLHNTLFLLSASAMMLSCDTEKNDEDSDEVGVKSRSDLCTQVGDWIFECQDVFSELDEDEGGFSVPGFEESDDPKSGAPHGDSGYEGSSYDTGYSSYESYSETGWNETGWDEPDFEDYSASDFALQCKLALEYVEHEYGAECAGYVEEFYACISKLECQEVENSTTCNKAFAAVLSKCEFEDDSMPEMKE